MNGKIITAISLAAAVIAAAIAAIVVTNNRAAVARAQAAQAESREAAAKAEAKKAKAEESIEASKAAAAKSAAEKAKADREKAVADEAAAKADAEAKAAAQETAKLEAEKARNEAQAAADLRSAAKHEADKEREKTAAIRLATEAAIAASNAVAQAEADRLATEKLKSEKVMAEARLAEMRKIDFETWQARLVELEQELTERERAMTPDIGINDSTNIVWVGERDPEILGVDTNQLARLKRKKVSVENDPSLPEATRRLAHAERELRTVVSGGMNSSSNAIVTSLTRLYEQAVRDGRAIDAAYYLRSLKFYNPNWEYKKP